MPLSGFLRRIGRLDNAPHAAAAIKLPGDDRPNRLDGLDKISEDTVDGVFIKDAEISIGKGIYLQRFQFCTPMVRNVSNRNVPEIGQPGPWADRGKFGDGDSDLIILKLILETFDFRQGGIHP